MKLSIETRPIGQRATELALSGEIDYASALDLRAAITAAFDSEIEVLAVNLAGVTFIDSTGVGTLVVARRICDDLGVKLQIREANPFVARLFAVVGVAERLGVSAPAGVVNVRTPRARVEPVIQPV